MHNISLNVRILFIVLLPILGLITIAAVSIETNNTTTATVSELTDEEVPLILALENAETAAANLVASGAEQFMDARFGQFVDFFWTFLNSGNVDTSEISDAVEVADDELEQFADARRSLLANAAFYVENVDRSRLSDPALVDELPRAAKDLNDAIIAFIGAEMEGSSSDDISNMTAVMATFTESREAVEVADAAFAELIEQLLVEERAYQEQVAANTVETSEDGRRLTTIVVFGTIIGTALFGTLVMLSIVLPFRAVGLAAEAMRDGNFDTRVDVKGNNEMARLGTVLNTLAANIQQNREDLLHAQRNARLGAWTWDGQTNTVTVSEVYEDIVGRKMGKIDDPTILSETVHPDDRGRVNRLVQGTFANGIPYEAEVRLVRPDGKVRYVISSGRRVDDKDGNPTRVVGTVLDITRRKEAELEREELIKELRGAKRIAEENSRLKSEFLSTMSHELRTPMNAIEGFSSIMLNRMGGAEFNAKTERYITKIKTNSQRLLGLINDFLDLSRIESGRLELAQSPVNLEDLVKTWRDSLSSLAEEKSLDYDVTLDSALPKTIVGDDEALSKIALNLLGNAIKFTKEGSVKLALTKHNDMMQLQVIDTGIGIPAHAREFIFDEFRQVDQSSKREFGGTGLGLSIVQQLVNAMGGSVQVDSEVGKGSKFTVLLPFTSAPAQEPAIKPV